VRLSRAIALTFTLAAVAATGAAAFGIDTDQPPPPGIVGKPYSFVFQLKAGAPPFTVYLDAGEIAPGLKIDLDGTMHGTPTAPGTFIFTVGASQCCGPDSQWGFTHVVRDKLTITTPSLPSAVVGTPYSAPVSVVGNHGVGMGWKVSAGALPAGLTLAPDGSPGDSTISGTPTTVGISTFTVKVGDIDGFTPDRSTTQQYTLAVVAALAAAPTGTIPTGIVGRPMLVTPATATGGLAPYTWSVASGAIPPGLTLDPASGALAGRPTAAGLFSFSLGVSDAGGRTATVDASMTVVGALDLVTTKLRPATVGKSYKATLRVRGGQAPRAFSVTGGKLPSGLKLNARTGVIGGKPKAAGTFRFRITARDALGQRSSERLTLSVRA
jgi:putative Ig domain-containing protein